MPHGSATEMRGDHKRRQEEAARVIMRHHAHECRGVMTAKPSRRDLLKKSAALAGLGALGWPEWMLPALAQGEVAVPFTDLPPTINLTPAPDRRLLDIRTIDGPL